MRILVLYYSGVGNTRMVAKKIFDILQASHQVSLASIEKLPLVLTLSDYDALVVGFATIHASPAKPMLDFIGQTNQLPKPVPTFLFTTCGLYAANTLRIFAKQCKNKNLYPILNKSYRCAATDGSLIAPFMNLWFCHEKELDKKVKNDTCDFVNLLSRQARAVIPRFKVYGILNYPNKFFGQHFSPKIYTHKENCILCGKCMVNCPVQGIDKDSNGFPAVQTARCIHCYRCIHHCPKRALSLSKRHPPAKTLYY